MRETDSRYRIETRQDEYGTTYWVVERNADTSRPYRIKSVKVSFGTLRAAQAYIARLSYQRSYRAARRAAYDSCGMVQVRGSLDGVYYE